MTMLYWLSVVALGICCLVVANGVDKLKQEVRDLKVQLLSEIERKDILVRRDFRRQLMDLERNLKIEDPKTPISAQPKVHYNPRRRV